MMWWSSMHDPSTVAAVTENIRDYRPLADAIRATLLG
jgi:hypothetical protein